MSEINKFLSLSSEDLETAQFLYESHRFRPCISRAYYAAQALLLSENLDKYVGKRNLKTQKAVAHAARALQLFGFWVQLCLPTYLDPQGYDQGNKSPLCSNRENIYKCVQIIE